MHKIQSFTIKLESSQEILLSKKTINQEFKEKDKLINFKQNLLQTMMTIELIFSKLATKIKKDKRVKLKDGLVRNLGETEEIDLSKELRLQLH